MDFPDLIGDWIVGGNFGGGEGSWKEIIEEYTLCLNS